MRASKLAVQPPGLCTPAESRNWNKTPESPPEPAALILTTMDTATATGMAILVDPATAMEGS